MITLVLRKFYGLTRPPLISFFFFFNDTATTEIYTLSLHDALPISSSFAVIVGLALFYRYLKDHRALRADKRTFLALLGDRKSTRLNSSHLVISYAVFCLKKKKNNAISSLLVRLA